MCKSRFLAILNSVLLTHRIYVRLQVAIRSDGLLANMRSLITDVSMAFCAYVTIQKACQYMRMREGSASVSVKSATP